MAFSGSVFKFATFVTKTGWNYHKNGKIRLNNVLSSIYQKEAKKKKKNFSSSQKKEKSKIIIVPSVEHVVPTYMVLFFFFLENQLIWYIINQSKPYL